MAVALLASQVPEPTGPSPVSILACDSSSTTAPTVDAVGSGSLSGLATHLNKLAAALADVAAFGGNGFGVISGLTLSVGSGLTLNIAAGYAAILGIRQIAGTSIAVSDNTTRVFVWLKVDGTVVSVDNSTTPPITNAVFLGSFPTSGGAIGTIDTSGVMYLRDGRLYRETADKGAPSDSPDSGRRFQTKTGAGLYEWSGTKYLPVGIVANTETLTADRTLTSLDAPIQVLTPSGAHRKVLLPASASADSPALELHNAATAGSFDIVVRDSGDTTTIATLNNGEMVRIYPRFGGLVAGSGIYPTVAVPPESAVP